MIQHLDTNGAVAVFGVLIVHWLTFGSNKTNADPRRGATVTDLTGSTAAFASLTLPETSKAHSKGSK
jgi:hypothetical protein